MKTANIKLSDSPSQQKNYKNISRNISYNIRSHKTPTSLLRTVKESHKMKLEKSKSKSKDKKKSKQKDLEQLLKNIPKNVNEIKHITDNNKSLSVGELNWTIMLRKYSIIAKEKNGENNKEYLDDKYRNIHPPSFYQEDEKKYKNKLRINSLHRPSSSTDDKNLNRIYHLIGCKSGITPDNSQFKFASTLRNFSSTNISFREKEKGTRSKNNTVSARWSIGPYNSNNEDYCVLPPTTKNGIINLHKMEKFTIRTYTSKYDHVTVKDHDVKRRRFVFNGDKINPILGEHFSNMPYTNKFHDPNIVLNKEIIKDCYSNPSIFFELGLRGQKTERVRIKRKSKEQLEKIREDLINEKHNFYQKYEDEIKKLKLKAKKN